MTALKKRIVVYIAAIVVFFGAASWRYYHPLVIRYKNHLAQIKMIGLALKLYADDHQGAMPHRVEDLMTVYFTDQRLLDGVQFLAADQKLPDLDASTVIARRMYPEDQLVADVRADQRAVVHKP